MTSEPLFTGEEHLDALTRAALTPEADVPGAMQDRLFRQLPDGTIISFEYAPAGYTAKNGERRRQDWRAYFIEHPGAKRVRLPSVTTWLNEICPKDLSRWGEREGIIGCWEAVLRRELDPYGDLEEGVPPHTHEDAVARVRALKLGADAARDRAATRGLDVHSVLEAYAKTGQAPDPGDFDEELQGYVRGLVDFLRDYDPEPDEVEYLVAHPERGYAGRVDMRANVCSKAFPGIRRPRIVDLKTANGGRIWTSAHYQTAAYRAADLRCGAAESDTPLIVVVSPDGSYGAMDCTVTDSDLEDALRFYRSKKPTDRACSDFAREQRTAA